MNKVRFTKWLPTKIPSRNGREYFRLTDNIQWILRDLRRDGIEFEIRRQGDKLAVFVDAIAMKKVRNVDQDHWRDQ